MQEFEVYSEKLDSTVKVCADASDTEINAFTEDDSSALVGWSHHGWNNSGGGGSW